MAERRAKRAGENEADSAAGRVLRLLRCVAEGEREFALKDLVARTGLAPSTVHRLLGFLVQADLVAYAGPKAYRQGPELLRIASLVLQKFDVQKLAGPRLHELWTQWQETCSFCLYKPATRTAVVVETIRTPHPLQFVVEPNTELSLAWGSMGRSILAHLPSGDVDAVLAHDRRGPLSGGSLPTRKSIYEELGRIRQRGYAIYEDKTLDVAGVAAAVFGPAGTVVGSIGVTMPASRFRKRDQPELTAAVMDKARHLSAAGGFTGS
jgi:DNA-binding IclR family transcriptional regulator